MRSESEPAREPATDPEAAPAPLPPPAEPPGLAARDGRRDGPRDGQREGQEAAAPGPPWQGSFELAERYRVEPEPLARGGMGVVWRARDQDLDRRVAMKSARSLRHADALRRETRVLAALDHPGICPLYDAHHAAVPPVYAMKLIEGESLARRIRAARAAAGSCPHALADAAAALLDPLLRVVDTIAYAHHKGFVHRDLKPDNVLVGGFGEVYVIDWGLALELGASRAPGGAGGAGGANAADVASRVPSEGLAGTPLYMAPEQARGDRGAVDERADVYGLGGILHELLTGEAPHAALLAEGTGGGASPASDTSAHGRSVSSSEAASSAADDAEARGSLRPEGPSAAPPSPRLRRLLARVCEGPRPDLDALRGGDLDELAAVAARALAPDPAERFPSALALGEALRGFLDHRASRQVAQGAARTLAEATGYAALTEALAGFRQARALWPANGAAAEGEARALLALAELAIARGELGLAADHLRQVDAAGAGPDAAAGTAVGAAVGAAAGAVDRREHRDRLGRALAKAETRRRAVRAVGGALAAVAALASAAAAWAYLRTAEVEVRPRVAAARVIVDGREAGHAGRDRPLALRLGPGRHELRIEADGYDPEHRLVDVAWGRARGADALPIEQRPRFERWRFEADVSEAAVVVEALDAERAPVRAATPIELLLERGRYRVRFERPGFVELAASGAGGEVTARSEPRTIAVLGSEAPQRLDAHLRPDTGIGLRGAVAGTVQVFSEAPGAVPAGEPRLDAPAVRFLWLEPGAWTVRAFGDGGHTERFVHRRLAPGERALVHLPSPDLRRWRVEGGGQIWGAPVGADLDGDGAAEVVLGQRAGQVVAIADDPVHGVRRAWTFPEEGSLGEIWTTPTAIDLDDDGRDEVLIVTPVGLVCIDTVGLAPAAGAVAGAPPVYAARERWRRGLPGRSASAAVIDLDGDGALEAVYPTWQDAELVVVALGGAAADDVAGAAPITRLALGGVAFATPGVGDLDGDGLPEVVVGLADGRLVVARADGRPARPGGPPSLAVAVTHQLDGPADAPPVVADLDGDGAPELLVAATLPSPTPEPGDARGRVIAFALERDPVTGAAVLAERWRFEGLGGPLVARPAVADLDGDGRNEVVVASREYDGHVYCLAVEGARSARLRWRFRTGGGDGSPAIGDVDADGRLEVIVGSWENHLYAIDPEGRPLWRHWARGQVLAPPGLIDVDRDGWPEVVIGGWDQHVHALDPTPRHGVDTGHAIVGRPLVGDVDGDGWPEVAVGSIDRGIYVFQQGAQRSGVFTVGGEARASPVRVARPGRLPLLLLAAAGAEPVLALEAPAGHLAGFSRVWTARFASRRLLGSPPAIADLDADGADEVVVGDWTGHVDVLAVADGAALASIALGAPVEERPLAARVASEPGGRIVLAVHAEPLGHRFEVGPEEALTQGRIVCLRYDTGALAPAWEVTLPAPPAAPVTADLDQDGHAEVLVACWDGVLYAFDLRDGALLDALPLGGGQLPSEAVVWDPAAPPGPRQAMGSEVLVVSRAGGLHAVGLDGTAGPGGRRGARGVRWTLGPPRSRPDEQDERMWPPPVVADLDRDGRADLVLLSQRGRLASVAPPTDAGGRPRVRWRLELGSRTAAAPALGDLDGDGLDEIAVGLWDGPARVIEPPRPDAVRWPPGGGRVRAAPRADADARW